MTVRRQSADLCGPILTQSINTQTHQKDARTNPSIKHSMCAELVTFYTMTSFLKLNREKQKLYPKNAKKKKGLVLCLPVQYVNIFTGSGLVN